MSFVNTQPAAISAAATQLEGIGNSFAAESSAAAASTTDVLPAASDEVSILQAGVFSTYGQLYQSVSAQAQAIHQQFVQLLNQSSGSYQDTEAANQAGAAANSLSNAARTASSAARKAATDPISCSRRADQRVDLDTQRLGPEQQHRQPGATSRSVTAHRPART